MSQDSRIGTEIAGYRIESLLGRGGMSVVYLAAQEFPKRKVALKLLAPELADQPGFRERFVRESNAAASLDHPNVIPIYGAGEHDGVLWIAMRYVDGTDLAHLIRDAGPLSAERTVHIVEQVASALDSAHEIGLVHRDVKPGNILLARSDHAYLCDFGITKRREAGTEFTKTGDFLGSVDYAAPEQIRGERVDPRADVYSLGCVVYECLTGGPPYPRETDLAVLYAHLNEDPPKLTSSRPDVPGAIDEVLTRAMAQRPEKRYATAGAMASAVREALNPAPSAGTGVAAVRARPRRTRAVIAGAAVVLAAAIALVVVSLAGGSPAAAPSDAARGSSSVGASGSTQSTGVAGQDEGPPPGLPIRLNTVAELDAATGRVLADFDVGSSPDSIALSGGRVWVVNDEDQTISVIDPKTREVEPPRGGVQSPCLLSPASDGGVWVSSCAGDLLSHIDPASLEVDRTFRVEAPGQAAEFKGSLWVVSERSVAGAFGTNDVVERLDPASGDVLGTITVGEGAADLSIADGAVWGCDFYDNNLWRIVPGSDRAQFFPSDQAGRQFDRPLRLAAGPAGFWVNDAPHVTQLDFDPYRVTGVLAIYGVPVVAGLNFWVVDGAGAFVDRDQVSLVVSRRIARVDLATHDVTVFDAPYATDAAAGDGVIWVSAGPIESPTTAQPRNTVAAEG